MLLYWFWEGRWTGRRPWAICGDAAVLIAQQHAACFWALLFGKGVCPTGESSELQQTHSEGKAELSCSQMEKCWGFLHLQQKLRCRVYRMWQCSSKVGKVQVMHIGMALQLWGAGSTAKLLGEVSYTPPNALENWWDESLPGLAWVPLSGNSLDNLLRSFLFVRLHAPGSCGFSLEPRKICFSANILIWPEWLLLTCAPVTSCRK